jgi:hypothetical protein
MRTLSTLLFTASVAALSLALAPDAAACGACFHGEMENTQVTGHKMIFSISQSASPPTPSSRTSSRPRR